MWCLVRMQLGNCEEQLSSTDCRSTVGQQITDRLPTGYRHVQSVTRLSLNLSEERGVEEWERRTGNP